MSDLSHQSALASAAERQPVERFNDDDVYLFKADTLELVEQIGAGNPRRRAILMGREVLPAGIAARTGMDVKRMGLWTPTEGAIVMRLANTVRLAYLGDKRVGIADYTAALELMARLKAKGVAA